MTSSMPPASVNRYHRPQSVYAQPIDQRKSAGLTIGKHHAVSGWQAVDERPCVASRVRQVRPLHSVPGGGGGVGVGGGGVGVGAGGGAGVSQDGAATASVPPASVNRSAAPRACTAPSPSTSANPLVGRSPITTPFLAGRPFDERPRVARRVRQGGHYTAAGWRGRRRRRGLRTGAHAVQRLHTGDVIRGERSRRQRAIAIARVHRGVSRRRVAEPEHMAELVREDVFEVGAAGHPFTP